MLVARVAEGAGLAFPGVPDTLTLPCLNLAFTRPPPKCPESTLRWGPSWHGPSLAVITYMQNAPKRRRGWQRMGWFDSIIDSMDMNLSKLQETVKDRGAWRAAVHAAKTQTWLSD